jgi:hypothetical protein
MFGLRLSVIADVERTSPMPKAFDASEQQNRRTENGKHSAHHAGEHQAAGRAAAP